MGRWVGVEYLECCWNNPLFLPYVPEFLPLYWYIDHPRLYFGVPPPTNGSDTDVSKDPGGEKQHPQGLSGVPRTGHEDRPRPLRPHLQKHGHVSPEEGVRESPFLPSLTSKDEDREQGVGSPGPSPPHVPGGSSWSGSTHRPDPGQEIDQTTAEEERVWGPTSDFGLHRGRGWTPSRRSCAREACPRSYK